MPPAFNYDAEHEKRVRVHPLTREIVSCRWLLCRRRASDLAIIGDSDNWIIDEFVMLCDEHIVLFLDLWEESATNP